MAYHLTTSFPRPSARSHASPKTHTPLPRLQERGHRFYSAELSRWISRDPEGEGREKHLFRFVNNGPNIRIDYLGRMTLTKSELELKECGEYSGYGDFTFEEDKVGQWVLQKVEISQKITKKGQRTVTQQPDGTLVGSCACCVDVDIPYSFVFYEAFKVRAAASSPNGKPGFRDAQAVYTVERCTIGSGEMKKTAILYGAISENDDGCPAGFHRSRGRERGDPVGPGPCVKDGRDAPEDWDVMLQYKLEWGSKSSWDCCPKWDGKTSAAWL
jgi:RHS repeat-associated protein